MKKKRKILFITTILTFILFTNISFASKRNFITEIFVFSKKNSMENLRSQTKQSQKKTPSKPRPVKYRNVMEYDFNFNYLQQVDIPYFISILPKKFRQYGEGYFENFDLDQNGKTDLVISYDDPVTGFLDLNENGVAEIEYLFNGSERWIYFDENEDTIADFLFKDLDGDGVNEEVIKIEN